MVVSRSLLRAAFNGLQAKWARFTRRKQKFIVRCEEGKSFFYPDYDWNCELFEGIHGCEVELNLYKTGDEMKNIQRDTSKK